MSATDIRHLQIELDSIDAQRGPAHWAHELDLRRQEYKVRIGSGGDADFLLPPERFPHIGRLHCAIVALPGRTALEFYHEHPAATLDGKPAHDATLEPGTHELAIGDDRFRLTLRLVESEDVPSRGD